MFCPNCGAEADCNFCPVCGYALRQKQSAIYLGHTQISRQQFAQIQQMLQAGEKLEAIKQIRLCTDLNLADAKYIADHFSAMDFHAPQQALPSHRRTPPKAAGAAKKVGKVAGATALFGGITIFKLLSALVKPYMGKRK